MTVALVDQAIQRFPGSRGIVFANLVFNDFQKCLSQQLAIFHNNERIGSNNRKRITFELTRRRESKHPSPHEASCETRSRRSRPTICSARAKLPQDQASHLFGGLTRYLCGNP